MIYYIKEDISEVEDDIKLLKAYLRYNRKTKVMPTEKIKDMLRGKDLYDMPEPTPRCEAQRSYDFVEGEYYELLYKSDLRYLKEQRKRMKRYSKGLDSYHKHAEKYENRIGVHKPETIGNF